MPQVLVASDDRRARSVAMEMGQAMGFAVSEVGGLKNARQLETQVLETFPVWRVPLLVTSLVFFLWGFYITYRMFVQYAGYFDWGQIFLLLANLPICMTAITVLALTYLPGTSRDRTVNRIGQIPNADGVLVTRL